MNINDVEVYSGSFWDWTFLNGCFRPTNIRVSDIDGFVERNGLFLVIETKAPGVSIPKGQQIMFKNMVRTGLFTVLLIWGETNQPECARVMTRQCEKQIDIVDNTWVCNFVRSWFEHANEYDPPGAAAVVGEVIQKMYDIQRMLV